MSETRIALAFVALGVALLAGTFHYLTYGGGTRSPRAPDAESIATAVPEEQRRRAGAQTDAAPREAGGGPPALAEAAPASVDGQPTPSERPAPVQTEGNASAARGWVPAYGAPLRESRSDGVTEVVVDTEATGEDELRLVASDLASYYPRAGVLLVEFREGTNGDASAGRETGFALVFGSREAALAPDLEYTPEEVDEIFEEDGGVRAVSYEDFGRENPSLKDELARISSS